jgi:uncharacterized protein
MQLTRNRNTSDHSIQSYTPGTIKINGVSYTRSLVLSPQQLIENWPPQTIQALQKQHLETLIQLHPEVVILGTGEQQHFLSGELLAGLIAKNIGFEVMHTTAACHTFNLLVAEGRHVVAGLIL